MAKQFRTITNIKLFSNDNGSATHGNSKWTPYKDGSSADLTFYGSRQYSVKLFDNGDGTLGLNISEVTEDGTPGSTGGLKPVAEVAPAPASSSMSLDDDIPF